MSPDTMTFGELVRDFLRVAVVEADHRWAVQVLNARLLRYLLRVQQRHELRWAVTPGETLELRPDAVAGLPETAGRAIGSAGIRQVVTARCVIAEPISDDLCLYAYLVDPAGGRSGRSEPEVVAVSALGPPPDAVVPAVAREGARRAILEAARRVMAHTGRATFTVREVIDDLSAHGSDYADQTIRTMIGAHLNADASGTGVAGYADVVRVSRGKYRLR